MDLQEETIVNGFLHAHAEVFPEDQEMRDSFDLEKLAGDARTLLTFGLVPITIVHLIHRDMRKRPGMGMVSPRTIRFCIRSVEQAAKSKPGRPSNDRMA